MIYEAEGAENVERCAQCWCCSVCAAQCDNHTETEDELVMRVLDIDSNSDEIVHAATCREKNIEDAKKTYFGDAELQIEAESSDESSDSFSEG